MSSAEAIRAAGLQSFPCRQDKTPLVDRGQDWGPASLLPLTQLRLSDINGIPVPPGVVVIDLDTYKGITREAMDAALGYRVPWDASLLQITQHGGEHHGFQAPGWPVAHGSNIKKIVGLDTRVGGKGYICVGNGYTPAGLIGALRMAYPAQLPALPDSARAVLERVVLDREEAPLPTGDRDVEQVVEMLRHITPHCDRTAWRNIGFALRHQFHDDPETGRALFDRWSAGGYSDAGEPSNYNVDTQDGQWESFKAEGGRGTGTLYYEACLGGWTPPVGFDAAAAFGADTASAGNLDDVIANGGNPKHTARLAALANGDPLLSAVLQRELKGAGLLTTALRKALEPRATAPHQPAPVAAPGYLLPSNIPMHTDLWAAYQTKGKDNKPKGTRDNFRAMMRAYGVTISYNEISKEVVMGGPGVPPTGVLHEEAALSFVDHLANLNDYPKADNRAMLLIMANENTFNPVRQYIDSAPWDGCDYLGELFQCLTLAPEEDAAMAEEMFRRWFLGAVAIGTGRASAMEHVLTLVDPEGGAGKTRFFRTLAPEALRKDSALLDTKNKDSVKMATSYWLVELGEVDGTLSRSEQARIKAHLSSSYDEMRLPYGRVYLRYPRRTAYFATVNPTTFLSDSSGNRRFWPIRVTHCDHLHAVNVQQAWAQAQACINAGQRWHLTSEENQLMAERNEAFRSHSRITDSLSQSLPEGAPAVEHMTVTAVLARAGVPNPLKPDLNEAAQWLRQRGYRETKQAGVQGFIVPRVMNAMVEAAFSPTLTDVSKGELDSCH